MANNTDSTFMAKALAGAIIGKFEEIYSGNSPVCPLLKSYIDDIRDLVPELNGYVMLTPEDTPLWFRNDFINSAVDSGTCYIKTYTVDRLREFMEDRHITNVYIGITEFLDSNTDDSYNAIIYYAKWYRFFWTNVAAVKLLVEEICNKIPGCSWKNFIVSNKSSDFSSVAIPSNTVTSSCHVKVTLKDANSKYTEILFAFCSVNMFERKGFINPLSDRYDEVALSVSNTSCMHHIVGGYTWEQALAFILRILRQ